MTNSALQHTVPYVNVAIADSSLRDELIGAFARVLSSGQFVLGDDIAKFEKRFATLCGTRFAISVNSGTDAMILSLRSLDIGPGDEVITAPNSYIATAAAIALVGARPVFVDVGTDFNIDTTLIEAAITPRTRAILPVHLPGPYTRSRLTQAWFTRMGISETVVANTEDYVRLATELAGDGDRCRDISQRMADARSVLYEDSETIVGLEDFFRRAVNDSQ